MTRFRSRERLASELIRLAQDAFTFVLVCGLGGGVKRPRLVLVFGLGTTAERRIHNNEMMAVADTLRQQQQWSNT